MLSQQLFLNSVTMGVWLGICESFINQLIQQSINVQLNTSFDIHSTIAKDFKDRCSLLATSQVTLIF
jgi:hypothetical protein